MANIDSGKAFGEGVPRADCAPFYAEIHLINLVNRLKDALIFGKAGEDLLHIIEGHKHEHPAFSSALQGFVTYAIKLHDGGLKQDAHRELFERLYTAEQLKTQALIEHIDL